MWRYFWKDLKPSILAKLDNQDLEQEIFDQMIEKIVNNKAEMAFQPHSSTREIDEYYSYGNWPTNSTIAKSQGSVKKDLYIEEPKI